MSAGKTVYPSGLRPAKRSAADVLNALRPLASGPALVSPTGPLTRRFASHGWDRPVRHVRLGGSRLRPYRREPRRTAGSRHVLPGALPLRPRRPQRKPDLGATSGRPVRHCPGPGGRRRGAGRGVRVRLRRRPQGPEVRVPIVRVDEEGHLLSTGQPAWSGVGVGWCGRISGIWMGWRWCCRRVRRSRWWSNRDPLRSRGGQADRPADLAPDVVERFWSKVETGPYCWAWRGAIQNGYGHFAVRPAVSYRATGTPSLLLRDQSQKG